MTSVSNLISPSSDNDTKSADSKKASRLPSATTMAYRRCEEAVQKLPPYVASFTLEQGKRFLSLVIDNQVKSLTLSKLQKDEYVPRSLRSSICLSGSNDVSRTPNFMTLAASLNTTTSDYIQNAKNIMMEASLLEKNVRSKKIFELLLKICLYCYQLFLMELGAPTTPDSQDTDHSLLFALTTELLFQSGTLLTELNNLQLEITVEERIEISAKVFPGINNPAFTTYKSTFNAHHESFTNYFKHIEELLNNLLFMPLQSYFTQRTVIQKESIRRNFIAQQRAQDKATTTAMLTDDEPTVSPQLLRSLIHKEVLKEVNKLKITNSNNSTNPNKGKNNSRGANNNNKNQSFNSKQGASLKKKPKKPKQAENPHNGKKSKKGSATQESKSNGGKNDDTKKKKNTSLRKTTK
jgi:hypothetical protein